MIELFIENYKADITPEISTLLTYVIDDIKDFSSRNTSFSKTIVMPGTARNNALFGNIFDFNNGNFYDPLLPNINFNFNAAKSAQAILFQDNIQVFKGVIRLMEIIIDNGVPEYETSVFGELGGFISVVGNLKLEDLDFSAYNQTYSVANIVASWNNTPGAGLFYPLIDYGTYSTDKHSWGFGTFRPAIYVKEYLDKIFAASKYTYQSDLFTSARFKELIIPLNKKNLTIKASNLLGAKRTSNFVVLNSGFPHQNRIFFDTVTTVIFTASDSNRTFTYNGSDTVTLKVTCSISGVYVASGRSYTLTINKNGTPAAASTKVLAQTSDNTARNYTWNGSAEITLSTNDYIEFQFTADPAVSGFTDYITCNAATISFVSDSAIPVTAQLGDSLEINDALPSNILQKDFFASILKLFNIYAFEDKFESQKIILEPYVDFYDTDPSHAVDWTYKLDRSKAISIKPMSELNSRYYEFDYKDDSDYWNDLYKKRYNISYGSYIFDSEFEFANESSKAELIFSGTPLVGYGGEDKVYSTIFKQSNNVEESIDSNIRILQSKKVTGVTSWDIKNGSTVLGSYTSYGYAGHLDDPDAPANDLNFGVPAELFFALQTGALNVNQFNVYWSSYMAEITDKDSRLVTATFRLTTKDIYNLDFSKLIYLDGGLFRLNKIEDYNASSDDVCKVQLLKVIQITY